jgi:glutamate-1-semialdehyde 2,1-aminomutase
MPNTVKFNSVYPSISVSDALYKKSIGLIPSGTQTLAKGPGQYTRGIAPKYIHKGKGSHVWDVDGNEYLDYNMGIGPVSLGYCYEKVDNAIIEQLRSGITFSMMHPLEVEVAELISSVIPNAEQGAMLPQQLFDLPGLTQAGKRYFAAGIMAGMTGI